MRTKQFFLVIAVLLLAFAERDLFGQASLADSKMANFSESRGKDFWVCFPQNAKNEFGAFMNFRLYITGDKETRGTVTIPGLGITKTFFLNANQILPVEIDTIAQVFGSDQILKLGVHVVTDNPVAVYGLSNRKASTDTYLAYPTNVLGTSYRGACYYALAGTEDAFTSQISFVATDNNTNVTITLTGNTKGGRHAGETFSVSMQQGDVYQLQGTTRGDAKSDLTGTLVTSSKPIAFFTGHICAQVPPNVNFCDQLLEEEPPIPSWGRQFYVGRFESKSEYVVRVISSEPGTQVFVNNQVVAKLKNAGEFYENNHLVENSLITTNKPVLVAEYAQSSDADSVKVGDPFMLFITPTEQFLKYYRFVTPVKGDWHHYVNLVVPNDAISTLKLDGRLIPPKFYKTIGISRYAIAQYEIGYGSHFVSCDLPFGLYSYGFGVAGDNYDSYGNNAGQLVETIPDMKDTVRPTLEIVSDDGKGPLALIARDDRIFDAGLASITIIDSSNFRSPVNVPKFDAGTPQVPLLFKIRDTGTCGFMSLRLADAAGNESFWVICRTQVGSMWVYQLYEGKGQICPSCKSWTIQVTATPSMTVSNVTFPKPSYLKGAGTFDDFRSRLSGGFALNYIYPFSKNFQISMGIGYSNFNGAAAATHTTFSQDSIYYGDTTGARKSKVVEEFVADATLSYLSIHGGIYHYFIPEKFYIYAGLSADILLSAHYSETAEILYPATLDYNTSIDSARQSTGARKVNLTSGTLPEATSFQLALELSPGVQFKLNKNFSLLVGAYINMPLFDAVKDLNWHLSTFGARLGLQYRN
ncbi:MAG: outer membrane beta-barrel protein [Bacteroidota bacterium]|nr:outer membrane beta-barrel protein [Bacteroidota bacterium]